MLYTARTFTLLMVFFCVALLRPAMAEPEAQQADAPDDSVKTYQYKRALTLSQGAIDGQVGDHMLTNHLSQSVSLAALRGKPLVLSMIYTSCYQICPMTTRHLANVVKKAREAIGEDSFNVAVIGFDAYNDSPRAMLDFATKQGIADSDWHLFSASAKTIKALSKEVGFDFFNSPNGFDHIVQATVIDAEGIVYRQVYGEVFETPLLVEPLMDLVLDRRKPDQTLLSELVDKVRFFCTTYDPARDAYHFDYSLFIGMGIGISIILTGVILAVRETRHRKRSMGT